MQIYEWVRKGGMTAFAVCSAVQDIRYRGIAAYTFFTFILLGLGITIWKLFLGEGEMIMIFMAFVPGICLWMISRATAGAVGEGDALYFLTAACFLNRDEVIWVLFTGLLFCAGTGLLLLLKDRMCGRDPATRRLPFTACLLPPLLGVLWC